MLDGGQKNQEDILPKMKTTMEVMQVTTGNKIMKSIFTSFVPLMHKLSFESLNVNFIAVLNDQYNNQDRALPFTLDLNQTITIRDAMQSGDGKKIVYSNLVDSKSFI